MKKIRSYYQALLIAILINSIYTIGIPLTFTGKSMNYLFVGNWKMNMHANKAINFVKDNFDQLHALAENQETELILCPSSVALASIINTLKPTNIDIGAQNCSQHKEGAYTGEISAQSLAEIGCSYCIVGHSERRQHFGETNEIVAEKVKQLYEHNIQPIICIGETKQEYEKKQVCDVLTKQLAPVLETLSSVRPEPVERTQRNIIIAYEPIWSIGTGIIPEHTYLEQVFIWLGDHIKKQLPHAQVQLLYGGSVNERNISDLKQILYINGFLIGGASTNFQKLKKIVQSN